MRVEPTSTAEISQLLAHCSEMQISIVPHGGLTGLSGGATTQADQLIISTNKLNRILSIDPLGGVAV